MYHQCINMCIIYVSTMYHRPRWEIRWMGCVDTCRYARIRPRSRYGADTEPDTEGVTRHHTEHDKALLHKSVPCI